MTTDRYLFCAPLQCWEELSTPCEIRFKIVFPTLEGHALQLPACDDMKLFIWEKLEFRNLILNIGEAHAASITLSFDLTHPNKFGFQRCSLNASGRRAHAASNLMSVGEATTFVLFFAIVWLISSRLDRFHGQTFLRVSFLRRATASRGQLGSPGHGIKLGHRLVWITLAGYMYIYILFFVFSCCATSRCLYTPAYRS